VAVDIGNVPPAGGPITPRLRNKIDVSGTWNTTATSTLTTGIADPFGGTGAVRITPTSSLGQVYCINDTAIDPDTGAQYTHAVGDRWAYFLWARCSNGIGAQSPQVGLTFQPDPTVNGGFQLIPLPPMTGQFGWQFYGAAGTLTTVTSAHSAIRAAIVVGQPNTVDVYQPLLIRAPNGALDDNEWANLVMTIRQYPRYLLPGVSGTMPGQKLIAHGGLGTSARYTVGVASGNITLGGANNKAVELFDESGNSLGVVALQSFTVNP
jgi:hypothetical protein